MNDYFPSFGNIGDANLCSQSPFKPEYENINCLLKNRYT